MYLKNDLIFYICIGLNIKKVLKKSTFKYNFFFKFYKIKHYIMLGYKSNDTKQI